MNSQERLLGIADLQSRLAAFGLNLIEHSEPWPHLSATYFEIGKPERTTDIVLSSEFLCDLPQTKEYQSAVEAYAQAVSGRIRCGSPNVFYCFSNRAISLSVKWPIQVAVFEGNPTAWLLVSVVDEQNKSVAKCCLNASRQFAYSGRTTFDDLRNAATRIRRAIDKGEIQFYERDTHPDRYQRINDESQTTLPAKSSRDVERFIAGKTHMLAFQIPEVPGEVFVADSWDAEYLGVSKKELSQAAYVLRARDLVHLDQSVSFARPADKLVTTDWSAIGLDAGTAASQVYELSALPKKEQLTEDLRSLLGRGGGTALVFVDLDKFKEVNDTRGHREGDACLGRVVVAIGGALGRKGTLYRWGGDEFAITLPDFSTDEALVTAERIRRAIRDAKPGGDVAVTASIGVCASDLVPKATAQELLDTADKAMYASKKGGKDRVTGWPLPAEPASEPSS